LSRLEWSAVAPAVLGLALLGLSLRAADSGSSSTSGTLVLAWLLGSAVAAAFSASLLAPAVGLGLAAGILYAGADVATKAAVGGRMFFVLGVIAASALAFACLQLGFQRGGPLTTIGVSTLLTNALPIAAGVVVFHEAVPAGWRGGLRVAAFVLVTTAAALLVRAAADGADEPSGKVSLVRPAEPSRRKPRPEQLRRRPRIAGE
jgi:hypothetical protein